MRIVRVTKAVCGSFSFHSGHTKEERRTQRKRKGARVNVGTSLRDLVMLMGCVVKQAECEQQS